MTLLKFFGHIRILVVLPIKCTDVFAAAPYLVYNLPKFKVVIYVALDAIRKAVPTLHRYIVSHP
jgi:hypothetical protein